MDYYWTAITYMVGLFAMAFALIVEFLNLRTQANLAARKLTKAHNP